jgi:hypothetical protein
MAADFGGAIFRFWNYDEPGYLKDQGTTADGKNDKG